MNQYKNILNNLENKRLRKLNDDVLIIDGMNTLIRSFSLIKSMNPDGSHIGGMVGFLRSLGYLVRTFDPTRVIVVWDGKGGSGNRQNIDPNYKAQRANSRITHWGLYDTKEQETEALVAQLYRVIDYIECLPIHQVMMEKLEADDIIAFMAKQAKKGKMTIVSSDKDFLQLINKNVEVYAPIKKKVYTYENVKEEIKVLPENYNVVKALLGDNSDNLKGVKGLGIKTIISEFDKLISDPTVDLDYVYSICEEKLEGKKIFPKIIHNWNQVENNFEIMDLHRDILDNSEKNTIFNILMEEIPALRTGAFLHYLENDGIQGITKNTESWLETFRSLTVYKK